MKILVPLVVYAAVSAVLGVLVLVVLRKQSAAKRSLALAAFIFFGGPPLVFGMLWLRETLALSSFEEDVAYVGELCAKNGGDKIYRTADNVEGVLQMRARNAGHDQLRDRDGMFDPWGFAQGDMAEPSIPVGYLADDYRFVEAQPSPGLSGPPFRRKVFVDTGRRVGDDNPRATPENAERRVWRHRWFSVTKLRSKYGYVTEDVTTPEMRRRWVGGGRIRIIDLATNEVMAERTGYFRAIGTMAKDHWGSAGAYQNRRICPHDSSLPRFLLAVLKPPPAVAPTSELVQSLTQD